jgi:two-component system, NarL family, nitrate/nitrite response regulator NarL
VLRVFLVGHDPLARAGLVSLLQREAEVVVVGQGSPAPDLGGTVAHETPDVIAWDLAGVADEDIGSLRESFGPSPPFIALVRDAEQARSAFAAGAHGALFRDVVPARLSAALLAVARGLMVADEALSEAAFRPQRRAVALVEPLTPREREVLGLLAEGLTNRAIAARLGISEHTAKFHVNAILGKLGVETRTEAVGEAARLGLVTF